MKLIPARLSVVQPSKKREFDIYIVNETNPVLLLSKDAPLEKNSQIFKNNSNRLVYIPSKQLNSYKHLVADTLDEIMEDKELSKSSKMYAVYISLTSRLEMLMNEGNIAATNGIFKGISHLIANTLNDTSSISVFLSFIKNDIGNISTHMFNVGTYATMLTKMLYPDISNIQLEKLAKGYFLHDVGMLKIDKKIVNKKEKYTDNEYEEIKKHPLLGVEIVKNELKINDPNIIKIVLQHHERKDGSGYPNGITDINRFAKICAMCDIFDAITSKREYKEDTPKTTFEALKENKEFFVQEFGKDHYEAFVKCFKV